ncbi:MAG: LPS-assembly protein LptD [Kiloniellales bacterium]
MTGGFEARAQLRALLLVLLLLAGLAFDLDGARAQELSADIPSLLRAEKITYDEGLGVVTASGNVEYSQGDRVVMADTVSYNLRSEVVTASGNVTILDPSGNALFADFAELSGDLREGFVREIRILMLDKSRLAAATGVRSGGNRTVFKRGVFSPCELCKEDPTRAPLWQIKAVEVEHDQEAQTITYRDAWMEIFGVPIIYTPFFQHPDPTVERKSGFLAPTIGRGDLLGATYQQPFFWNIAPNVDLTLAPIFTTKQSVVAAGQYRHLFTNGMIDIDASGTVADRINDDGSLSEGQLRGHIDGTVDFDLNDTWRAGAEIQRATDDTYLRLYDFSSDRTLVTRGFTEALDGRNYFSINSYLFQGLREDDHDREAPIIVPVIDYNFVSEPGRYGGTYSLDANVLDLVRREGRDSRRLSVIGGWHLPFEGQFGELYKLTAQVQADGYWVNGVDPASDEINPPGQTTNDFVGRAIPQAALQVRYPWVRRDEGFSQIVEPILQVVAGPGGGNPGEIPNEDSLDLEFDDTNLFSLNRFPGRDRIDSSSRVDYALKYSFVRDEGGYASALVGQSFRFEENSAFKEGSGLEDRVSDMVGRVQLQPIDYLDFLYRFRFDKQSLTARRNELGMNIGPPALHLSLGYLFLTEEGDNAEFEDREEVTLGLRSRIDENWSFFGRTRRDLTDDRSLDTQLGVTYQDECIQIDVAAERNFFNDREISSDDSIFVRVVFKHLGEVGAN